MPNHYRRGVDLERQAAFLLRDQGWWVTRAAGSHGLADLVALHPAHRPWLVQCKIDLRNMSLDEWAQLFNWATDLNCVPVVVDRSGTRGQPVFRFVMGVRPARAVIADYLAPVDWGAM